MMAFSLDPLKMTWPFQKSACGQVTPLSPARLPELEASVVLRHMLKAACACRCPQKSFVSSVFVAQFLGQGL